MDSFDTRSLVPLNKSEGGRQLPLFGEATSATQPDAEQEFWDGISAVSKAEIKATNDLVTRALFGK